MLLSFLEYLNEEEKKTQSVGSDPKGKLHELLVGYHLRNGNHMSKHKDDGKHSPKEAHDLIKSSLSKEDYDKINERAKAAAEDIKKHLKKHGHKIDDVHWTSKEGDIENSTGIKSSQKEDASDIIIHAKDKKGKRVFHGISLKVTDSKSKNVPVSNPGMETTYGAQKILERHREKIKKKYPQLNISKKAERKRIVKEDPQLASELKSLHGKALNDITEHLHNHLSSMHSKDLAEHIRKHVLQSHKTPMQTQGHHHIRHTTYVGKDNSHAFHSIDPHEHYENILKDHKNITTERRGTSIIFKHKGKAFAKHRLKFESQSDPMSSVKGSGEPM